MRKWIYTGVTTKLHHPAPRRLPPKRKKKHMKFVVVFSHRSIMIRRDVI